jgi:hypothetical protein
VWAERPWQLTKLAWMLLAHALFPISLTSTANFIRRFVEHLRKPKAIARKRKLEAFREALKFG